MCDVSGIWYLLALLVDLQILDIIFKIKVLKQVDHFKYREPVVNQEGRTEQEIKIRIAQAKSDFIRMGNILTSKDITLALRIRLVKCYIYPIVLYGAETWTLLKESEKRIDAFEMWIFRRMARISWKEKVRNEDVLARLGVIREHSKQQRPTNYPILDI